MVSLTHIASNDLVEEFEDEGHDEARYEHYQWTNGNACLKWIKGTWDLGIILQGRFKLDARKGEGGGKKVRK